MKDITRERIKEQMELFEMSYGDVSDKVGIPRSTLHHYVTSDGKIPISFIKKVAPALHTTESYLLGIDDEKITIENSKRGLLYAMTEGMDDEQLDILIAIADQFLS